MRPLSPWVLRAMIMTVLYGVGQTAFVALASRFASLALLWTVLLLGAVLLVGLVWGGAEVIADRVPPEWTWLKAALAAGPAAGLTTWVLLALFVDATGVEDLGAALVGRASFTILLILASVSLGSWFGWFSLRRADDPRAAQDPGADVDGPGGEVPDGPRPTSDEPPVLPASTTDKVAARRRRGPSPAVAAPTPAPREADDREPTRLPFGTGPFAERSVSSPVVAVLPPVTPLPDRSAGSAASSASSASSSAEPEDEERPSGRRRFGLRRPD